MNKSLEVLKARGLLERLGDSYSHVYSAGELVELANMFNRITELETKLEEAQKDAAWQPIETAPKDGTPILAYNNRMVLEVWYSVPWGKFVVSETGGSNLISPTHWMPLPKPPLAGEAT